MEAIVRKVRGLRNITPTPAALTIYALPFALLFVLMHLFFLIFDDNVAVIVSDSKTCNEIGRDMLGEGGSVVDAAIAILFCESLLIPHRIGIGGGFTAIIYVRRSFETIVATPRAPSAFKSGYISEKKWGRKGGATSVAVPGSLMGCWQMHKKYGLLTWQRLLEPTIQLAEDGVPEEYMLHKEEHKIMLDEPRDWAVRRILEESRLDNNTIKSGGKLKFPVLAQTLRLIANKGADIFYKGSVGVDIVDDIRAKGGRMRMADFANYNVSWSTKPIKFRIHGGYQGYTTPLPTSGAIVALVMNTVRSLPNKGGAVFWHKTIEAMKHAYGLSFSLSDIENEQNEHIVRLVRRVYAKMLDNDFAAHLRDIFELNNIKRNLSFYGAQHNSSFRSSSANICITANNGDAIALTADMSAKDDENIFRSITTGVTLNNELKNFRPFGKRHLDVVSVLPPSPNSYMRPGKRPFASHCPLIVLNRKKSRVFLVVSASGDETAPAQLITTLIKSCYERTDVLRATNSWFFYPDVLYDQIKLQPPTAGAVLKKEISQYLQAMGHNFSTHPQPYAIRSAIHIGVKPNGQYTYQQAGGINTLLPKHELDIFMTFIVVSVAVVTLMTLSIEIIRASKKKKQLVKK